MGGAAGHTAVAVPVGAIERVAAMESQSEAVTDDATKRPACRTTRLLGALAFALGLSVSAIDGPRLATLSLVTTAEARAPTYKSTREAYEQGVGAYRSGFYEIAVEPLEYVVGRNDPQYRLFAEFYLARIFADNAGSRTDHAKAYMLFQRIADEHADIDPDDLNRAPFVAKALTAVALYVRDGLPEISLKPDEQRAIEYLRHAATFFNEPDAQFELAKLLLADDRQRPAGLHYLQKLAQEGHAAAQAVLADLLSRGKYVAEDRTRALGLIKMAIDNAQTYDRIWIEDIYQAIYCNASKDVREKSKGLVATWKKLFAQPRSAVEPPGARSGLGMAARVCSNGERLEMATERPPSAAVAAPTVQPPALGIVPATTGTPASAPTTR